MEVKGLCDVGLSEIQGIRNGWKCLELSSRRVEGFCYIMSDAPKLERIKEMSEYHVGEEEWDTYNEVMVIRVKCRGVEKENDEELKKWLSDLDSYMKRRDIGW